MFKTKFSRRRKLTQLLIEEHGFNLIAVEGDWPDCHLLNQHIRGENRGDVRKTMKSFKRWPTWMWANWETVALTEWLHKYNKKLPSDKKVGFYGLDVYSLWESMEAILIYLHKKDPIAFRSVQKAMDCFGIRKLFVPFCRIMESSPISPD